MRDNSRELFIKCHQQCPASSVHVCCVHVFLHVPETQANERLGNNFSSNQTFVRLQVSEVMLAHLSYYALLRLLGICWHGFQLLQLVLYLCIVGRSLCYRVCSQRPFCTICAIFKGRQVQSDWWINVSCPLMRHGWADWSLFVLLQSGLQWLHHCDVVSQKVESIQAKHWEQNPVKLFRCDKCPSTQIPWLTG